MRPPLSLLLVVTKNTDIASPPLLKKHPLLPISQESPHYAPQFIRHPRRSTQIANRLIRFDTPIRTLDSDLQIALSNPTRMNRQIRRRGRPQRRVTRQIGNEDVEPNTQPVRLALRLGNMAQAREEEDLVKGFLDLELRGDGRGEGSRELGGVEDLDICWVGESAGDVVVV